MTNRRQLMQSALASVLGLTHLPNFAQTRLENLRIIVGFPPGGTTDAFSRRIAEKMRGTYANNVIVDNKPGAGGQIGVTTLKSAAADGAHILVFARIHADHLPALLQSPELCAIRCDPHRYWAFH